MLPELISIINLVMQYLIVPAIVWVFWLHKDLVILQTEVAVLRAEATARDRARKEERETFSKQLDQILVAVNSINGRIDNMMNSNNSNH